MSWFVSIVCDRCRRDASRMKGGYRDGNRTPYVGDLRINLKRQGWTYKAPKTSKHRIDLCPDCATKG